MTTRKSPVNAKNGFWRGAFNNSRFLKVVQIFSWVVTGIFLAFLANAVFQAVANGESLPLWAWLGALVIIAVAIGIAIMVVVYRSVSKEGGVMNLGPSTHVAGELRQETRRVAADGANFLHLDMQMIEGSLQVTGGAEQALEASFIYDDAGWKQPEVAYEVDETGRGSLKVKQRATHRPAMRQGRNEWVVRLNQNLPTDLNVQFGAGKAELLLSGLTLSRLAVESGVGELTLDLSGDWPQSFEATVKVGIGDTSLRIPRNVGVRLHSAVSMGSTHANELTWDGEAYTNALYGQTDVALDITIMGGMGKINIE